MAGSQTLERRVGYSASREMSCAALSATPYLSPPSSSSTAHRWALASSARYAAGSTVALVRIWLGGVPRESSQRTIVSHIVDAWHPTW